MKKIRIAREANWYGLFNTLELYADGSDELELGEIAAGETIELALSADVTHVYGEMSGVPTEWFSTANIKDGDTIVIRSIATISNFFSTQQIPLVFRILAPGEFVDVGAKKQKVRSIIKAFGIAAILMIASIAWIKEGWRLSGYDTKSQMEMARAGGFSDKDAFLKAQAVSLNTAIEWKNLLVEASEAGFDDPKEFIQFRDGEFISKDEFIRAKAVGASSRREWLADADWREITTFPDKLLTIMASDGGCDIIKSTTYSARFAGSRAGRYRSADLIIIQPYHRKKYYVLFNELVNQRQFFNEDIKRMWRSEKDDRYYLAYFAVNTFQVFFEDDDGIFREVLAQLNGAVYTDTQRLSDSVDVMDRVKSRRSPDEYRDWGILPGNMGGKRQIMCNPRDYETIENVRFVDKETGKTATISELLSRETLDERAPVRELSTGRGATQSRARADVTRIPENQPSRARGVTVRRLPSFEYPARALRDGVEGTVRLEVIVAADGNARRCLVTSSSGSEILDDAACRTAMRGRFEPALDFYGRPIDGSYVRGVTYKIQ